MKTAYELAMERLSRTAPMKKMSEAQKKQLAEVESVYAARIAEREIGLAGEAAQAEAAGNAEAAEQARARLAAERSKLAAEREARKEAIRQGA